jgi:hypothetical protein
VKHLSESQLSARLDGALSGDDLARVKSHLATCVECRTRLEALADGERALRKALQHDPGEAYFATFADRVQARLRAEGLVGAQAHQGGRIADWFGRSRNLAIAGAVATVIVGAGIVLIHSREVEVPTLRRPEIERHTAAPPVSRLEVQQSEPSATPMTTPSIGANAPSEVEPGASGPSTDTRGRAAEPPTASGSEGATSQRAYEVRRDEHGEDVPVNPPRALGPPAPTPANAVQPEAGGRVIKQRRAEPMGLAPAPSPSAASAPSAVPPGPDTAPLMQRRAAAPNASASTPAVGPPVPSASAPAPSAGAPTADALARSKDEAPATSARKTAKAAPPLPAPHSLTPPSTASRAMEREEHAPARPQEAQAKRTLVIDERQGASAGELCGQVLDTGGHAVGAAEVIIAETGASARTDASGHFCIRAPAGDRTLVVMAVGYEEMRRPVAVAERSPQLEFVMRAVAAQEMPSGASSVLGFTARPRDSAAPAPTAPLEKPTRGQTWGAPKALYGTGPQTSTLDQLMSEAQRISADAAKGGSASHYETAAEAWERVLPLVRGKPAEDDVRFHIAEQRYLAWEAHPSHSRSLAAHTALTTYVLHAPAGAQRDKATRWLGAINP